jgi:hypothetical protein
VVWRVGGGVATMDLSCHLTNHRASVALSRITVRTWEKVVMVEDTYYSADTFLVPTSLKVLEYIETCFLSSEDVSFSSRG